MKLLLGQVETVERNGIKVVVKVVSTATQARLSDLSVDPSIEGRVKLIGYMLNNMIESVSVDGVDFDPKELATKADISDPDTMAKMFEIGAMAISTAFPSEADAKK